MGSLKRSWPSRTPSLNSTAWLPLKNAGAVMSTSGRTYLKVAMTCSAWADEIHVPGDYPTIQAGIDAAAAGQSAYGAAASAASAAA